jgi:hypothetical protein
MIVGCNASDFDAMRQAVPGATARRVYYPTVNEWPATWPLVAGSTAVLTIRPLPADLLAGNLDASIRGLFESGPPGSLANAWHEAGNLPAYRELPYINPARIRAVHQHMHQLAQGTNVAYGPVLCMPPGSMPPWMPGGMDWYGLDIYDWPQFRDGADVSQALLADRLGKWQAVVERVTGQKNTALAICETNSDRLPYRAQWFSRLGQGAAEVGLTHLLGFWSATGCGPWLPDDANTISALNALAALTSARAR